MKFNRLIKKIALNPMTSLTIMLGSTTIITGCSTMHFTQNVSAQQTVSNDIDSQWHDTTLNGMVEISYPVNLYQTCKSQPWKQVTVEFGFVAGLTTVATDTIINSLVPGLSLINMYAPWDVNTRCTVATQQ